MVCLKEVGHLLKTVGIMYVWQLLAGIKKSSCMFKGLAEKNWAFLPATVFTDSDLFMEKEDVSESDYYL